MDNTKEKVTWLMPVKNGVPYLPETLASIEAQTYRDWEVIVWDNGSTDGTLDILRRWIPTRLPGRIISDQPLGLGASRRALVQECQTELCAIMDADDICLPERLEREVAHLQRHPEIAVVGSRIIPITSNGSVITDRAVYDPTRLPLQHKDIVHAMLRYCPITQPSVMFRRSAVQEAGNYHSKPDIEDYDLWMRVAAHHKIANLDMSLLKYRIHDKSTTQISIAKNILEEVTTSCFSENAPLLFGCASEDAKLLREKRHPDTRKQLYKIAEYLAQTQPDELKDRFQSPSFLRAAQDCVPPTDFPTRLRLAAMDSQRSVLLRTVLGVLKTTISKYQLHNLN